MGLDQAQLEALLGRPLTTVESANRELYLKIANESLETMLCSTICGDDSNRVFEAREGYRTLFVDFFNDIDEVLIDGDVVDADSYSVRQWDKRNGSWYNSLVFQDKFSCDTEVEVSASWGFDKMPSDLQFVLAGLFDMIGKTNSFDGSVKSKQVEDFRVTLNESLDLDAEFANKYSRTLAKYSLCSVGNVRNGKVCLWSRS